MSSQYYNDQNHEVGVLLEALKDRDVNRAQLAYLQIPQEAGIITYILTNEFWSIYNFLYVFPDKWLNVIRFATELKAQGVVVHDSDTFANKPHKESLNDLIEDVLFNQRWTGTITPNEVKAITNIFVVNDQTDLLVLVPSPNTNKNISFISWSEKLDIVPNIEEVLYSLSNRQRRVLIDDVNKGDHEKIADLVYKTLHY